MTAPDQCCSIVKKLLPGRRPHMTHSDTSRLPIAAVRKAYSMTSSAMESTACGTSMPSARA